MIRRLTMLRLFILNFSGDAGFAQYEMQKSVLITGASASIGRNMAEALATEGYY
jgi:hypothetical protein